MSITDPLVLAPDKWYYDENKQIVFLVLENNLTFIHEDEEYEGYILAKHPDTPPEKMGVDTIIKQLETGNVSKLEDATVDTISSEYTA